MEPLAENRFLLTEGLFMEGMAAVQAAGYARQVRKLLFGLAVLWLLLAGYALYRGESLLLPLLELVALLLVGLWAAVLLPRRRARRAFEKLSARTGASSERVTRFYADHLEVTAAGQKTVVAYGDIEQVLPARRLLVLVSRDKTGVMLQKDAFVRGDEESVQQLIKTAKQAQKEEKYD